MKRTLTLSRERLVSLTTDELSDVAGAAAAPTGPVLQCLNATLHSEVVCYTRGTTCAC